MGLRKWISRDPLHIVRKPEPSDGREIAGGIAEAVPVFGVLAGAFVGLIAILMRRRRRVR